MLSNGEARAYRFQENGFNIDLLNDNLGGKPLSIIYSKERNIIFAYQSELEDGTAVTLSAVQNKMPIVMNDTDGNKFNIFGEVTEGPQQGKKLRPVTSMIAYWFAWAAFYTNSTIAN